MNNRFSSLVDYTQYVGLLLAILLVPLVFYIGNQNIVILKPLIAEFIMFALFGLWLIDSLEKGSFELPKTALNKPIVLYMLWIVITIIFSSVFWYYSIEEMGRYLAMFLMFFLVQKTVHSESRVRWTFWILFLVCFVATAWGFVQRFHQMGLVRQPIVDWGREVMVSTFGNKNFFAGFLVLTTPVIFGYIWATRKWVIRGILLGLFTAGFYILMATGTRTGFLGFWIGMLVFLFLTFRFVWFKEFLKTKASRRNFIIFGFVFATIVVLTYFVIPSHLLDRLGGAFDLQYGTQRVRWIMWTGATRAATAAPIMGHGHGVFQLVFPNYRPTFYHRFRVSHNTRHSHNEFLEVLMETGLVGLSLFLLLFVVLGIISYRFMKRCDSQFYNFLIIGLISGISASLAQNFASVNFRWMSSTFTLWLLVSLIFPIISIAAGGGQDNRNEGGRRIKSNYRWLPSLSWKTTIHAGVIGAIILVGINFYHLVQADFKLKRLNGLINLAESDRRGVSWNNAISTGKESVQYSPYSLSTRYKLGFAYLQKGDYANAHRQYDILTDMAPNYAQIHNNIALIHRRFNHPYRSLLHFEWATALEDNTRNHLNLTQRYTKSNLSDYATLHALYIPRIAREDHRDIFYVLTHRKSRSGLPRRGVLQTLPEYNRKDRQRQRMNGILSRYFSNKNEELGRFYKFRQFVSSATQRRTAMRVMQASRQDQTVDPHVMLGLVRKLRGLSQRRGSQFRQLYLQSLRQWVAESDSPDSVMRLAYAELLAQTGDLNRAESIVNDLPSSLTQHGFYRKSIRYIDGMS